jgi:hypothetical protein
MNPMPPNEQQILFYPVDETFKQSSLSFPLLVCAIPILAILSTWMVAFGVIAYGVVLTEKIFKTDKKYTKKILAYLTKKGLLK